MSRRRESHGLLAVRRRRRLASLSLLLLLLLLLWLRLGWGLSLLLWRRKREARGGWSSRVHPLADGTPAQRVVLVGSSCCPVLFLPAETLLSIVNVHWHASFRTDTEIPFTFALSIDHVSFTLFGLHFLQLLFASTFCEHSFPDLSESGLPSRTHSNPSSVNR